jgi:hypothetical protein
VVNEGDFEWLSPLGVSVLLFIVQAALTIVVSVVILLLNHVITTEAHHETGGFILSGRMDSLFFGKNVQQLVNDNPDLLEADRYTLYVRAGQWLAFGIFQIALAWFGLRNGESWALATIVLANVAALAGWIGVLVPFVSKGIALGLDLPPVVLTLAAIILPIATIAGWVGLRQ